MSDSGTQLPEVHRGLPADFRLEDAVSGFFWASPRGYVNGHDPAQMHAAACRLIEIEVLNGRHGMVVKSS